MMRLCSAVVALAFGLVSLGTLAGCGLRLQGLGTDEPYQLYLEADTGKVSEETVRTLSELLPFVADAGAERPLAKVRLLSQSVGASTLAVGGGARGAERQMRLVLRYKLHTVLPEDALQEKQTQQQCQQVGNHPIDEVRSLANGTRWRALVQQLARGCVVQMRYQALRQLEQMRQNVAEAKAKAEAEAEAEAVEKEAEQ